MSIEGWSITIISAYLQTPRHRVYEVLKRWVEEGHAGLDDKPSTPHHPARKVTMREIHEVKKLAVENPELGAYRVRAALEQIGIKLSQATCGRLLALNRKLYELPHSKGGTPREKKDMPFKASYRHEYWSVDVRYIEEHNLGFPEPVYLISILENYSRGVLASKVSPTQNQWDYLEVLFAALSTAGVPKAIVSDGGGIFYCTHAMDIYAALGIEKKRIDKRQAWENYIETHFNIVRRMADAKFARATSWEEMISIHRKWMQDYNTHAIGRMKSVRTDAIVPPRSSAGTKEACTRQRSSIVSCLLPATPATWTSMAFCVFSIGSSMANGAWRVNQ